MDHLPITTILQNAGTINQAIDAIKASGLLGQFEVTGFVVRAHKGFKLWTLSANGYLHETLHATIAEASEEFANQVHMGLEAGWERTCNICDGLGHGYPGAGPCPLESPFGMNYQTPEEDYLEAIDPQVNGELSGAGRWS